MRKIDPASVKADFIEQLDAIKGFFDTTCTKLDNSTDQSTLAEHMLMAAAVAWEGFISDLFIALMNRDSSQLARHLENSFNELLRDSGKPLAAFKRFGKLEFPKHLKKIDVQSLANPSGNNITFSNYDRLETGAATFLCADDAKKFKSIKPSEKAVIDSLLAVRNQIAHRSERSSTAMHAALANGALHSTGLKRGERRPSNVGAWLKAKPSPAKDRRLFIFIETLKVVANSY
ncbi:hypothetical protein JAK64_05835 [Stenotrophomonas maltophilia]|nr:hypothetical protein [Stenotrophomonas maltophilia]